MKSYDGHGRPRTHVAVYDVFAWWGEEVIKTDRTGRSRGQQDFLLLS